MRFVDAALRRPAPVAIAIGGVVLLLAAPALGLKTGPLSPEQLPKDDPARQDAERITDAARQRLRSAVPDRRRADDGPMTEAKRLAALAAASDGSRRCRGGDVVGPAQISRAVRPLQDRATGCSPRR